VAYRYRNANPDHRPHGPGAILRWGVTDRILGRRKKRPPGRPAPMVTPDCELIHRGSIEPWMMWLGHASFLGSLGGDRFLIDPVFSNHVGWLYRRYLPPALACDQLPEVAAVMITHNHYDHLDAEALRALAKDIPIVVPEGLGAWMRRRGHRRVVELRWWQQTSIARLRITLVPACHWSRRGVVDTNRTLWGGYVVEGKGASIYHAGDTAAANGFGEIARRFPSLDAALLPIGGYEPGWFMERYHLTPEQAGEAFLAVDAQRLVPMHWGTFQLTDEPLSEPAERISSWWQAQGPGDGRSLRLLAVGDIISLEGS
jgi:L-ascorbate metabolism protein UlaG (beta-lactamase superfamily)